YNYFVKNHKADFLEYKDSYYSDCLKLYQSWSRKRKEGHGDIIYQQMLDDSFLSFQTALRYYKKLGLRGYVVRLRSPQAAKINGKIKACTFGYSLNKETFCVLFEICDLNFKGIAQYVFREFCKKLSGYKYINIMGASDLENLKTVKLSYHPKKEIGVYNIYQK
ncbi:MAG: phosphatidylglycerol lysyltransferase domain-containing protein, partial [Candidatus Omnitrophota bacterium]